MGFDQFYLEVTDARAVRLIKTTNLRGTDGVRFHLHLGAQPSTLTYLHYRAPFNKMNGLLSLLVITTSVFLVEDDSNIFYTSEVDLMHLHLKLPGENIVPRAVPKLNYSAGPFRLQLKRN